MAQSGYTPIQLYYSSTTTNVPSAGNLSSGELAINITDGKLFYKDNGGVVQTLATKATGTIGGSNTQVQYNSSGSLAGSANFTFNGTTATINTLNLTNPLATAYGGTGLSTFTANRVFYASSTSVIAQSANLTFDGTTLTTTAFQVDNLNLNGNTFSSTDTNGNIVITPNGTGRTTVTNLTTTSPRIVTGINDTNGNELFLFTATASAVNEVTLANAATGNAPTFTSSGSDSNIDLVFSAKGTGQVKETVSGANYALASAYDVGTAPNEIPLNQYLGSMAFTTATNYNTNASPNVISVNSSSTALRITQTGSGDALVVEDASPDSSPFVVDTSGRVAIGGTTIAGTSLRIPGVSTSAVTSNSISIENTIQSDVTSSWRGILIRPTTQAASFTLSSLYGVYVNPQTFGAGSVVTNQYAFFAESTLTGATNNFGFYSNIASGTGRFNFYANGTADNYFAGNTGIGAGTVAARLHVRQDQDGTTRTIIQNRNATGTPISQIAFITGTYDIGDSRYAYIESAGGASQYIAFATGNGGSPVERLRIDATGAVFITGLNGTLGYGTGSGGAVTQTTSRTQGVTLDRASGAITLVSAAGTTTWQSFTVTNARVAATDTIIVNQKSGTDLYMIHVTAVAAGSFRITFATTGGTTTEQPVFNFAVIKASIS